MASPTAEVVDNPLGFEGSEADIQDLQPALGDLMTRACDLFDDVYPDAKHPTTRPSFFPIYRTMTENLCPVERIPMGRELTVELESGGWIKIFRNGHGSPLSFPRKMLWVVKPIPEGGGSRRTTVMTTPDPTMPNYPYNIEVADFHTEGLLDFVGESYVDKEKFIDAGIVAVGEAKSLAKQVGFGPFTDFSKVAA